MQEAQRILGQYLIDTRATGSRVICDPPPEVTDDDCVCLVSEFIPVDRLLRANGYNRSGKFAYSRLVNFHSYKNPDTDINFIVTKKKGFYDRFLEATWIAKDLNLRDKPERVALFETIVYGTRNKYADIKYDS